MSTSDGAKPGTPTPDANPPSSAPAPSEESAWVSSDVYVAALPKGAKGNGAVINAGAFKDFDDFVKTRDRLRELRGRSLGGNVYGAQMRRHRSKRDSKCV